MGDPERRLRSNVSVRPAHVEKSGAVSADDSIVFIIDDDPSMCDALTRLLGTRLYDVNPRDPQCMGLAVVVALRG